MPLGLMHPLGWLRCPCACVQDGLYFLHKEGHYAGGGSPCPLALLWKDDACSSYLLVNGDGLGGGPCPCCERAHAVIAAPSISAATPYCTLWTAVLVRCASRHTVMLRKRWYKRLHYHAVYHCCGHSDVPAPMQDTDASGAVPPHQALVLEYCHDGSVATADDPPVVLGRSARKQTSCQ